MNKLSNLQARFFYLLVLIFMSGQVSAALTSTIDVSPNSGAGAGARSTSIASPMGFPIEMPRLIVNNIGSYAGEKIRIIATHMQGRQMDMPVGMSNWQIINAEDVVVVDESSGAMLEWTPEIAGVYTAKHTFTDNEIELSVSTDLYILNAVDKTIDIMARFWVVEDKLIGTWKGKIVSTFGNNSEVNVAFYKDGSYVISRINRDNFFARTPDFSVPKPPSPPRSPPRILPPPAPPVIINPTPPSGEVVRPPSNEDGVTAGSLVEPVPEPMPMPPMLVSNIIRFNQEEGNYELLDIWANGEVVGNMNPIKYSSMSNENMQHIRFNAEYNMLFFDFQMGMFFRGNAESFVLSRISDTASPPTLEVIKDKLIGEWLGSVITPWATPYEVSFGIEEDGRYQAKSVSETVLFDGENLGIISPLYFGAKDQTSDASQFTIDNFEKRIASGKIDLTLKNGDIVSGTVSDLEMSLDFSILTFTFQHYGKYGPMQYVLERQ